MHEVIHLWSDGYGAELEFRMMPGLTGTPHATVVLRCDQPDLFADADDLRALAKAAIAMADELDSAGICGDCRKEG